MITIGADPELFLTTLENKDILVSAIDRIGGSKQHPLDIGKGCAVQEDNVAAEFCIPPATTPEDFIKSIKYAIAYIAATAKDQNLTVATGISAHSFHPTQLQSMKAQEFGCEPDYDAWTLSVNPRPTATDKNLRSAGGHIHIGTTKHPAEVTKAMDLFAGVPSISFDPDTRRRELYGKPGAHRPKEYGVEYRTLSNFWIWSSGSIRWAFDTAVKAEAFAETYNFTKEDEELIKACINKTDFNAQAMLLKKFKKQGLSLRMPRT